MSNLRQSTELKHLHAFQVLLPEQWKILKKINDFFQGQWALAWNSARLNALLPRAFHASRSKLNPDQLWSELLKHDFSLLTPNDKDYPPALKNIADPPFLLYVQGSTSVLKNPSLAVVGTRQLTAYGQRATPWLVEKIARAGLTIVSGLARGIDRLAHQTALQVNGLTVAVLGSGINPRFVIYENRSLMKEIVKKGGAIISEFPPTAPGSKTSFPLRNRIISGLSLGALIVEADEQSGSLITARLALEQNREVFALPGSIFSAQSRGTNNLLRLGARVVTQADDILTELGFSSTNVTHSLNLDSPLEKEVAKIIGEQTLTADEIIRSSRQPAAEIISVLMKMELEEKIKNLGQNQFVLNNQPR